MSYPARRRELPESSPHLAPSTQERVGEVLGGASQATAGGTHPDLFKRTKEALRSRSKIKPQWGQRNTRSSKVKLWLIPPHRKHSRDVLYAGTGKTSFSLFRNSHSSTALKKRNRTAVASSFYFRSSGSNPERLNPLALIGRTPVCRKPSLKSRA